MVFVGIFLFYAACVFVLIIVHECGHYLAGRIGGIPAGEMQIRLFAFPQHVVLKSESDWVSPADIDRYVNVVWEKLHTKARVYLYVAGGFLVETLFTVALAAALIFANQPKLAWWIAALSLMMGAPWLVIEPIMILRGKIFGDLSGLWFLNKPLTFLFVILLIGVRLLILWRAS